jgi:hypothetical protein
MAVKFISLIEPRFVDRRIGRWSFLEEADPYRFPHLSTLLVNSTMTKCPQLTVLLTVFLTRAAPITEERCIMRERPCLKVGKSGKG